MCIRDRHRPLRTGADFAQPGTLHPQQLLRRIREARQGEDLPRPAMQVTAHPVSYTHLDVYKRQVREK